MVHIRGASAKLLMACKNYFRHPAGIFTRYITVLATGHKRTVYKSRQSVYSELCCRDTRVTSPVTINCRLKSDSTVNEVEHFVELGMPQSTDDVHWLTENTNRRKMTVNVADLYSRFKRFERLEQVKEDLLSERLQNADAVKQMKEQKVPEQSVDRQKLLAKGVELRSQIKQFMDAEYTPLHSQLHREVLQLPPQLHGSTLQDDTVLDEFGTKTEYSSDMQTHIELGKKWKSLFFRPVFSGAYYLTQDLALMDHHLMVSACRLLRSCGFRHFACPDTVKSNILEGCGMNTDEVFNVEADELGRSTLHVLGVSCPVFAAFFASTIVRKSTLPLQLFAARQSHSPAGNDCSPGLYHVTQTSTVDVFGADANQEDSDVFFDRCLKVVRHVYTSLQLHGKIVLVGASGLKSVESRRVDIYVWSSVYQTYFKSGELRQFGDHISRRLGSRYTDEDKLNYLHTVHGMLVNVPTVLAALIEHNQTPVIHLCQAIQQSHLQL